MANISHLVEYRQKIMSALLNDKDICELLLGHSITDNDADIQDEVRKKHIFRYARIRGVQLETRSYIAFDLKARKNNSKSLYKNMSLYFFIFSHQDIIENSNGNLIPDLLDERIQQLFVESRLFNGWQMECELDDILSVGENHYGRQLHFIVPDMAVSRCT